MHGSGHPGARGRVEHRRRAADVDTHEVRHRPVLVHERRRVDHQVDAGEHRDQRGAVGDVEPRRLDPGFVQSRGQRREVDSRHPGTLGGEAPGRRGADEPRRPGDRDPAAVESIHGRLISPHRGRKQRSGPLVYSRGLRSLRSSMRPSAALRTAVRVGAGTALAAAAFGPVAAQAAPDPDRGHHRRGRRGPACARRPLASLEEPGRRPVRDADVGVPDGPRAALRRPRGAARRACAPATRSSSTACSARGELPTVRLQRALAGRRGQRRSIGRSRWVHWVWFFEPYLALLLILLRHNERFPRAARQMAATYDLGCAVYFAMPTAPPWWSSEQGADRDGEVRRIMVEVGRGRTWGRAWGPMYDALGGNPWAAMPSLHFATSLMAALAAGRERGGRRGLAGCAYAGDAGGRPRLPRRALRHRPARRRRTGRRRARGRAAGRAARRPR